MVSQLIGLQEELVRSLSFYHSIFAHFSVQVGTFREEFNLAATVNNSAHGGVTDERTKVDYD